MHCSAGDATTDFHLIRQLIAAGYRIEIFRKMEHIKHKREDWILHVIKSYSKFCSSLVIVGSARTLGL